MSSNLNEQYKEKYSSVTAAVSRIGEKAVWLNAKQDGVGREIPVGKAAFKSESLIRIEAYRGPLPMEFRIFVASWLTSQWRRQGVEL